MDAIVLKCPTNARFHFGLTAPDNDTALSTSSACFYSDTLFSALIIICSKAFPGEVKNLVTIFKSGGVRISSGQYCMDIIENNQFSRRIYFLPKPAHLNLLDKEISERKKLRGIKYISKTIWEKGLTPKEWRAEGCYSIDGKFLVHPEELHPNLGALIPALYALETEAKIADHARKKEDNIFFQTDVFLQSTVLTEDTLGLIRGADSKIKQMEFQPHFYFLMHYEKVEERMKKLLGLLFDLLIDEGLGGAISTGCGRFESIEKVERWNLDFKDIASSKTQEISLSLVGLKAHEISGMQAANLIIRGGRKIGARENLKRVKMLMPGALLTKGTMGELVELHDSQPFLRYGKTFPISISANYELKKDEEPNA